MRCRSTARGWRPATSSWTTARSAPGHADARLTWSATAPPTAGGSPCCAWRRPAAADREEARHLRAHGHRFRTRGDTEVLVHAWEQWGEQSVQRLDGMFAYAVWDGEQRRLFLARDRMGEKPLYYAATPSAFVFGSELRALLEHPAVPAELSLDALSAYLAFEYVPDPLSMVAGVAKLPPGHTLTVRAGEPPRVAPYWDIR